MIVRNSRNWLRPARAFVLPAATFVFAPAVLAQSAPIPPAAASAGATIPGTATPPSQSAAPAAPAVPVQDAPPVPPVAVAPAAMSEAPVDAPDEHGKKHKHGKNAKKDREHAAGTGVTTAAGRIQLKGRVFALAELQRRERLEPTGVGMDVALAGYNALDLSVASARIGFEYEAPMRWLSATVELELSGKPELKDGYVQARGQHFFARAGQFKPPTAALETESPWTLPLARRGFVHDLLTDWLDVGGRRPGLMLGWRGRGGLRPRFMVGAFQGSIQSGVTAGDRNTDLLEQTSLEAQSYVARAQFEPADIQIGGWYEHRVGSSSSFESKHYITGGLDAVVDRLLPGGGVRVWVEGTAGTSWYEHSQKAKDDKDAIFFTARALAGYRFGGTVDEAAYVEPFGFFGVLEPDTEVRRDFAWEAAVGVNAGLWRRARLTLQGEINRGQRNFPVAYLGGAEPDRMGLLLQAGVAW